MAAAATPRALILDDDLDSLEALKGLVAQAHFQVRSAQSLKEAREAMKGEMFDLALLDIELPDGSGLELIEPLETEHSAEVVIVTGYGSVDSAVEAFRSGVVDYLTKPVELNRLRLLLNKVQHTVDLRNQVRNLREELRQLGRFGPLIGVSPPMQRVYDMIERVAPTDACVLVVGETGTGKELVAETLHGLSRRARQPFVDINCGAVAPTLIEAELFGHEKGSFTGATRSRAGLFERANGGTLLLDEISEMPIDLQVRLLRVLETSQLRRVGGDHNIDVDVRIVAASNRDPEQAVRDGQLREDLLYRLSVFPIQLPPLRERGRDVELIAVHFLDELNRERGTSKIFAPETLQKLARHSWPGNVRELRNAVERIHILAQGDVIRPDVLPLSNGASSTGNGASGESIESGSLQVAVGSSIAEVERRLILATLEQLCGDKRATAEKLGISLKTLYNRLNVYRAR
jgi:DNA-binding NtrC family response regulator